MIPWRWFCVFIWKVINCNSLRWIQHLKDSVYVPKWSLPAQQVILVDDPSNRPAFPHTSSIADQIGSSVTAREECLMLLQETKDTC